MTLGGTQPMKFGRVFGSFSLYWDYCSQRGCWLNSLEVSLLKKYHLCKIERRVAEKYVGY